MEKTSYPVRVLAPLGLFLTAFLFLLAGLNPTFYADDSPETITAAATLGIPHPPGYPLLTLLGHLASLFPLGGIPFRVNLLSAFLASLVCALLFLFLNRCLKVSPWIAAPVALLWAAGASLYPAALSAKGEVYELNALLLLGLFWALQEGRLSLAVFLAGVFCTHHWMTLLVFLPGLLWMAYLKRETDPEKRLLFFNVALFFVLGSSLWIVLPLLSVKVPMLDWGSPSTFKNFLFVVLRREYLGAEANGKASDWIAQGGYALTGQWAEFAGLSLAALFLALPLLKKKEPLALGLFTGWACLLASVCLYLHLSPERLYVIDSYELVSHLAVLIFLGWGLGRAIGFSLPSQRLRLSMMAAIVLTLWLTGLGTFRSLKDRQTGYTGVYDFVLNSFKCVPHNSLFFCRGDSLVFPSWYFQWVENLRPDLVVAGVDGLPMEWIRRNMHLQHPGLAVPYSRTPMGNEAISSLMSWIVIKNKTLPQYMSYNQIDSKSQPIQGLLPYGLVYQYFGDQLLPALDEALANKLWDSLRLRHLSDPQFPMDSRTREWVLGDYCVDRDGLGLYYENLADDASAKLPKNFKTGSQTNIIEDYFKSLQQYAWCQALDPANAIYDFNVANALVHLGKNDEALNWYAKAQVLDPKYKDAFFNAAVAALNLGQGQKAGEMFQKVLDIDPKNAEAQRGLSYVRTQGLYRPEL